MDGHNSYNVNEFRYVFQLMLVHRSRLSLEESSFPIRERRLGRLCLENTLLSTNKSSEESIILGDVVKFPVIKSWQFHMFLLHIYWGIVAWWNDQRSFIKRKCRRIFLTTVGVQWGGVHCLLCYLIYSCKIKFNSNTFFIMAYVTVVLRRKQNPRQQQQAMVIYQHMDEWKSVWRNGLIQILRIHTNLRWNVKEVKIRLAQAHSAAMTSTMEKQSSVFLQILNYKYPVLSILLYGCENRN